MYYPLGMKSYNNYVNQGGYKSWKGPQTPMGLTSGTIRPLTNNDPTNDSNPGFGLPRPIKHHRKGRGFNYKVLVADGNNYKEVDMNRLNRSSTTGNLVSQLIDQPGGFNRTEEKNGQIKMVMSYYPNDAYLTENPEPRSQTPAWCCNAEKKARRRVTYASTNLKKNYFTTLQQYRENRCLTYDQRAFNFAEGNPNIGKPGGPEATNSTYYANCQPNTEMNIGDPSAFFDSLLSKRIITQEQYDRFKTVSLYDQLDEMVKLLPVGAMEQLQSNWQQFLIEIDTNHDGKITYDELLQVLPEGYTIEQLNARFDTVDINKNRLYDFEDILYIVIGNEYDFFGFQPYPRTNISFDDIYRYLNTLSSDIRANAMNSLNVDKRCTAVVYKPNNYQFAKQGAVDSSTRLLKLNVDTITKCAFTQKNNMLKSKVPACNNPPVLRFQNKQACRSSQPILATAPSYFTEPDVSVRLQNFSFNEQHSELY